jgi:electron transport complex protein RnfC
VEGCPTRINPAGLLEAAQRRNLDLADHYGLDSCIECGICTYVCPSHLPLLEGIRQLQKQSDRAMKQMAGGSESTG